MEEYNNRTASMKGFLWEPSVETETSEGTRAIPVLTKHLTNRKIFITGEINADSSCEFISQLLLLTSQSNEPIDIYISSPGGSVDAGLAMYDAIQTFKDTVVINMYCIGMAASMGAVLFAGGQKGRRFILPHGKVMIHEPRIMDGLGGSTSSIKKTSDSMIKTRDTLSVILSEHTGKSKKEINKAISFDNYMNAEEAIKFGLCDEITGLR